MTDRLSESLMREIELHCCFVLRGRDLIADAVDRRDHIGVWFGIQATLGAAAGISKLLWGPEHDADRSAVREHLKIDETSPIRARIVRNAFEHIDARIESWHRGGESGTYWDRSVHPVEHRNRELEPDRFGHYDQTTGVVSFWTDSVSILDLAEEAERLLSILDNEWRFDELRIYREGESRDY